MRTGDKKIDVGGLCRAVFKDTGRLRDMPNAVKYLERHDRAMMGSALEVVGIRRLSVPFPVSSFQ